MAELADLREYRDIAGISLGVALPGPVTAIQWDQPERRSWPRRASRSCSQLPLCGRPFRRSGTGRAPPHCDGWLGW